jgi:hypothetical protein
MNMPGFTAEASLGAFRAQYHADARSQRSVVAAVMPTQISCLTQCILENCQEWWFDCHAENNNRWGLQLCLNRHYYPCVNSCKVQCAGN